MAAATKKSKSKTTRNPKPQAAHSTLSTPSSPLSDRNWNILAISCAILSLFLYWNCIDNDFVFDDFAAVVQNPNVLGESSIYGIFQNDFWATPLRDALSNKSFRPLTTLSFRWSHSFFGMNPRHFHGVNIFLNSICVYLMVKCIQQMTPSSMSWRFPVVTCLLFTFHPIHTEVVATVVGRADLLSSVLNLVAFIQYSKCLECDVVIYSRPFLATLILAWCSALCKETGLAILGICGALQVIHVWFYPSKNKMYTSIMKFTLLASTGVSYLLFRKVINGKHAGILPSAGDNPLILADNKMQYICTALYIQVVYLWKLIYPFPLLCDYGYNVIPLVVGWNDVRNVITMVVVMSVVSMTIMALLYGNKTTTDNKLQRESCKLIFVSLAWIFIPLLPASHVLVLGTVVAERLLYLPSLGICMLVGVLVEWISKRHKQHSPTIMTILVVLLAAFTRRIVSRNVEWSTTVNLWKADYQSHPQNVKIALAYAHDLHQAGQKGDAYQVVKDLEGLGDLQHFEVCALKAKLTALSLHDYTRAYQILDPCVQQVNARTLTNPSQKDYVVFAAYGYLKSRQEEFQQAADWFEQAKNAAERANVNTPGPVCNQGEILARMNQWAKSVDVLRTCADLSIRARDSDETKLMNLAKAYYMSRDFHKAEAVLIEEMTQTPEVLEFLETVKSARVKYQEWEERKRQAATADAASEAEKAKEPIDEEQQQEHVEKEHEREEL